MLDGELLRNVPRLRSIPAVLIHGRLDIGGPPDPAWQLAQAWSGAELRLLDTGHAGGADTQTCIVEASDRFAGATR